MGWEFFTPQEMLLSADLVPLLEAWRAGDDRAAARDFRAVNAIQGEGSEPDPDGSGKRALKLLQ